MQVSKKFVGGMLEAKNWIEFTPEEPDAFHGDYLDLRYC
jgi:hypothetical protein